MDQKLIPYSLEAEQSVLGALMLAGNAWDRVAHLLDARDFYRKDHQLIFEAIGDLASQDQPCDVVTVHEWGERNGRAADMGGLAYLGNIANDIGSAANVVAYARIVRERAVMRRLINAGTEIADLGYQPEGRDARSLLDTAEQTLAEVAKAAQTGDNQGPRLAGDTLPAVEAELIRMGESDDSMAGLSTGLADLDRITRGLVPSDLIILAARPSMGKSALSMQIAKRAALRGEAALVFSLEMSARQVVSRCVCQTEHIDSDRMRTGRLDASDWAKFRDGRERLEQAPLWIDDQGGLTVVEIRRRARALNRNHRLSLIVVDFLQLIRFAPRSRGDFKHHHEIGNITKQLKELAKELDVPVMVLSQLNRGLESRDDKRPRLSDLRESGSIEEDADLVMMLYREDAHRKDTVHAGIAEVNIAKQRMGATGVVELTWLSTFTSFENYCGPTYAARVRAAKGSKKEADEDDDDGFDYNP